MLLRLADGEPIGTQLVAETMTLAARKQWLADHLQVRGRLTLDAGAVRALTRGRQEPAADRRVRPDRRIRARRGGELPGSARHARSRAGWSTTAPARRGRILRAPSHEIEARLGYVDEPELIHRDNLVLL